LASSRAPLLRDFDTLAGRFDRLFEPSWLVTNPIASPATMTGSYPAVDIYDEGDALCLEAELPGYRKDDIEVSRRTASCSSRVSVAPFSISFPPGVRSGAVIKGLGARGRDPRANPSATVRGATRVS
jgi:hypothetical protein